jgi:predicted lipase
LDTAEVNKHPKNSTFKGGALAVISATELSLQGYRDRIELMSFGKPRVGNKEFAEFVAKTVKQHWRVVNQKDIGLNCISTYI